MTDVVRRIRRALAGIAAVCFFLPLGQCTGVRFEHVGTDHRLEIVEDRNATDTFVPARSIDWAPASFSAFISDTLVVCVFFWPLLAVAFDGRAKSNTARNLINGAELLAAGGALYFLSLWLMFRHVLLAGYVAMGAFAALFVVSLLENIREVRTWLKWKRAKLTSS